MKVVVWMLFSERLVAALSNPRKQGRVRAHTVADNTYEGPSPVLAIPLVECRYPDGTRTW
jgi:hypothetical protein